jgi:hypothetical protein
LTYREAKRFARPAQKENAAAERIPKNLCAARAFRAARFSPSW